MSHKKVGVRRRVVGVFAAVLIAGFLAFPACGLSASDKSNASDKETQLKAVEAEIARTRDRISKVKKKEKGVLTELEKAEKELDATRAKLVRLEAQLKAIIKEVKIAERDLAVARKDLEKAQKVLSWRLATFERRLRAVYMRGPASYLEILTSARDFSELSSRFLLLERFLQEDARLFEAVKAEKEAVEKEKAAIAGRKATLEKKQAKYENLMNQVRLEETNLEKRVKEREAILARIQNERKTYEEALDELEATSRNLEKIIREAQAGQKDKAGPVWTGKFIWPVSGRITSDYGWRVHPIFRSRRFHTGIDISVPMGTPVAASGGGTVLYSGSLTGYGKTVILDHGGGISTLYGHNSVLLVTKGQSVKQGATIAKAGSTGFSTGPHVHFEVREKGAPVNPWPWLQGKGK